MDPLESKHDWTKMPNLMKPLNPGVSLVESLDESKYYGITINIMPAKRMNGRLWKDYDNDKQKAQLERILNKLFKENPSIQCIERNYEICPKLKNTHVHMLVKCAEKWLSHIEAYINRICHLTGVTTYETIKIDNLLGLLDKSQWLQYIRKEIL